MEQHAKRFADLSDLSDEALTSLGARSTVREIAGQPTVWREVALLLAQESSKIEDARACARRGGITFCGAGSSDYVGRSIRAVVGRKLSVPVNVLATTDVVTMSRDELQRLGSTLYVSFARSGDSPESCATYERVRHDQPFAHQLIITCNPNGELARRAASAAGRSSVVVLPRETFDQGLAMTGSFSSMLLAGLSIAFDPRGPEFKRVVDASSRAAQRVLLSGIAEELAGMGASRVCYLGSGDLAGIAQEAALKALELSDGSISIWDGTYLAFRHGPRVFADRRAVLVGLLSSDPRVTPYERDLLEEAGKRRQPLAMVAIGDTPAVRSVEPWVNRTLGTGERLEEGASVVVGLAGVVFAQAFALFISLRCGLAPDTPSSDQVISRVVQGIRIYE